MLLNMAARFVCSTRHRGMKSAMWLCIIVSLWMMNSLKLPISSGIQHALWLEAGKFVP